MTPLQFVQKWSKIQIKETAASQSHFNDLCALVNHPTPTQSLEDRPRYTPTTTFETSPSPGPSQEPAETQDDRVFAIAQAARVLNSLLR